MLIYLQVRDPNGALRIQRLDRLTLEQQSAMVHGDVERVHQVDPQGAVVEDVRTGLVKKHGREYTGPGLLADLRAKIKKPKPKGAKTGA